MALDQRIETRTPDPFQQIESVMDLLPVGIMLVSGRDACEARVARYNAACASLLGAAPAVGAKASEASYSYFRSNRREPLPHGEWPSIRAIASGQAVHEPALHVRRPDGEWRVLSASAAPVRRDGSVHGAVLVYQDVTAQHDLEGALRESEERFQKLVATVPGALYEYQLDPGGGRFTYLSARCSDIFEVDGQDIVDDIGVLRTMSKPGDVCAIQESSRTASLTGGTHSSEVRIVTPSGTQKWVQFLSTACPPRPGAQAGRSGFILDVTERKVTEEALRDTEEWLNLTVEATAAGTLYAVPYGPAVVSPRFMTMFGMEDPGAIKDFESFLRLLHPDDRDRVRTTIERALDPAGDGIYDVQYRCVWPDGRVRWIAARGKVQFAQVEGVRRAVKLVVVTLDITERKREEEALRASEARYARLAATVPGVLYEFARYPDGTGRFNYVSPRCSEIFEVDAEAMMADMEIHRRMMDPADSRAFEETSLAANRAGMPFSAEVRLTTPSGRQKWIQFTSLPCPSAPGEPIMRSGFILDVTSRKLTEEALREADRRKNRFLAVLSHELRNPLAPIRNSLFLLGRAAPGSEQAERARQVIDRQTRHLARLVDDLLDMTRISHGKIELQAQPLDLGAILRRTCDDHRSLFEQRGLDLILEERDPVWVDADETRIAQVIGNLLQNALRFTPQGGTTTVCVRADGRHAVVEVRDSGAGMEPDRVQAMFEPFAQADSSLAHPHGGLGLGLALAKGLMELHGGSISGRSDGLGRGSEFTLRLPLGAPRPSTPATPVPSAAPAGRLVLVIEDNTDAAQTLAEVLEVAGCRVHIALDGRTGIASARELTPDVVLCDIGLPDVDGYEVARILRGERSLSSTRVVALTGYAQPEDCARALEAGFDAHLAKPASIEELERLIDGR